MTQPWHLEPVTRENSALLLIDHQVGTNFVSGAQSDLALRNAVRGLARAAKNFNIPTVITDSYPEGPNGPTMSWITDLFPDAPLIHRPGPIDSFGDPAFVEAVEALGRRKLVMTGVTAEVCAAFPARSALARGYEVYVAYDAAGAHDEWTMHATMHRMTQMGAVVLPWFAVAADWQQDWRLDGGEGLAEIFSEHLVFYEYLRQPRA
jgi:nicotinamidase-related amidase